MSKFDKILGRLRERDNNLGNMSFLDLLDVPASYTGHAGEVVTVNPGETGLIFTVNSSSDEKVKVDVADSTAGYLDGKLVAGSGISLTPSVGPNKTLTIAAPGSTTDEKFKIDIADSTAGYASDKLLPGTNIGFTVSGGPNKTITINNTDPGMSCADVVDCVEQAPSLDLSFPTVTLGTLSGDIDFVPGTTIDWTGVTSTGHEDFDAGYTGYYDGSTLIFDDVNTDFNGASTLDFNDTTAVSFNDNSTLNFGAGTTIDNNGGTINLYSTDVNIATSDITIDDSAIHLNSTDVDMNDGSLLITDVDTNITGGTTIYNNTTVNYYSTDVNYDVNSYVTINNLDVTNITVGGDDLISDDAYGPGWDSITNVAPSQNALYDIIQQIINGGQFGTDGRPNGYYIPFIIRNITYYGANLFDQGYTDNFNRMPQSASYDVNAKICIGLGTMIGAYGLQQNFIKNSNGAIQGIEFTPTTTTIYVVNKPILVNGILYQIVNDSGTLYMYRIDTANDLSVSGNWNKNYTINGYSLNANDSLAGAYDGYIYIQRLNATAGITSMDFRRFTDNGSQLTYVDTVTITLTPSPSATVGGGRVNYYNDGFVNDNGIYINYTNFKNGGENRNDIQEYSHDTLAWVREREWNAEMATSNSIYSLSRLTWVDSQYNGNAATIHMQHLFKVF